jgi:hypothetical protein
MGKRKRDIGWDILPTDVNQASIFPPFHFPEQIMELQPIEAQLDDADNFDDWYHDVVRRLRTENLHRLIDKNIPRPAKSDDEADDWYKLSQYVQKWLAAGISQKFNQDIAALGKRTILADEFMHQVKKALQVLGPYADQRRVYAFEAIKRSDYPSTSKYVKAVKVKFSRMCTVSPVIPPYYALMRILRQINQSPSQYDPQEEEAVSDVMRTLKMRKHNSLVDKFTLTDFKRYCTRMIEVMDEDKDEDDDEDDDDEDDEEEDDEEEDDD